MPTTRGGRGSRNKNRNNGRGGGKGSNSGNGKKRNSPPDSQSNYIRTHQRMTMTTRLTPETIHKPVILLIRLRNHQRNYSHIPTNLDNDTSSAFVVHPVTGESLRFPFITNEMKTDDYFNADFDFHH